MRQRSQRNRANGIKWRWNVAKPRIIQARNPFETREPKRAEIKEARELARMVGLGCYKMFEANERKDGKRNEKVDA